VLVAIGISAAGQRSVLGVSVSLWRSEFPRGGGLAI